MSKNNKNKNVWRSTIGGICGGAVEACALHPLDTVKTRLQLQGVRVSSASVVRF